MEHFNERLASRAFGLGIVGILGGMFHSFYTTIKQHRIDHNRLTAGYYLETRRYEDLDRILGETKDPIGRFSVLEPWYIVESPLLVRAAHRKSIEGCRIILDHGGDPNAECDHDGSPLLQALKMGDRELTRFLVDKGAELPNYIASEDSGPEDWPGMFRYTGPNYVEVELRDYKKRYDAYTAGESVPALSLVRRASDDDI